jgi:hypothetical protein
VHADLPNVKYGVNRGKGVASAPWYVFDGKRHDGAAAARPLSCAGRPAAAAGFGAAAAAPDKESGRVGITRPPARGRGASRRRLCDGSAPDTVERRSVYSHCP